MKRDRGDRGCDVADARCYLLDFRTRDGSTELSPGEHACDLARNDGQWLFARRVVSMDRRFTANDIWRPAARARTPGSRTSC